MARLTFDVSISLDRIICHDEGDGWGDAEPYLWTAFFRISGDDVEVKLRSVDWSTSQPTADVGLVGSPLVQFSPGSHGNLDNTDVDAGDTVSIPSAIGDFETRLKPIPIPDDLRALADLVGLEVPEDLPAFVGAVVVLMEEDNVSDDGAEAGHAALNDAIRAAIQQIIDTRSIENAGVSESEISALTDSISSTVSDAIADQQSFFENTGEGAPDPPLDATRSA